MHRPHSQCSDVIQQGDGYRRAQREPWLYPALCSGIRSNCALLAFSRDDFDTRRVSTVQRCDWLSLASEASHNSRTTEGSRFLFGRRIAFKFKLAETRFSYQI